MCVCVCVFVYLKDVCFEDVVAQLNGLLAVEFAILTGEPEGQESVTTPTWEPGKERRERKRRKRTTERRRVG